MGGIVGKVGSCSDGGGGTLTSTLEGGHMVVSDNAAAATVTAAGSVADGGIDIDVPAAATMSADDAASSMLEKREAQ